VTRLFLQCFTECFPQVLVPNTKAQWHPSYIQSAFAVSDARFSSGITERVHIVWKLSSLILGGIMALGMCGVANARGGTYHHSDPVFLKSVETTKKMPINAGVRHHYGAPSHVPHLTTPKQ